MSSESSNGIFDRDLDRVEANYQTLTPIGFLERSAAVYPDKTAVIHTSARYTYAQFYER